MKKQPVAIEVDGSDVVVVRPVGMLEQSFDHRAFDGAYSAAFLAKLKQVIETRDWASELALAGPSADARPAPDRPARFSRAAWKIT